MTRPIFTWGECELAVGRIDCKSMEALGSVYGESETSGLEKYM